MSQGGMNSVRGMVARDEGGVRGSVGGPRGNDLESEL